MEDCSVMRGTGQLGLENSQKKVRRVRELSIYFGPFLSINYFLRLLLTLLNAVELNSVLT